MGAKGSKVAKDMAQKRGDKVDEHKIEELVAGLTYQPTDRSPINLDLHEEDDEEASEKFALACYHLFSEQECHALIGLTQEMEYKKGSQSMGIPFATNVTLDSRMISELIWERIQKYVPKEFHGRAVHGADTKVRFVKYDAADAVNSKKPVPWLAIGSNPLSAVVFLNDDYQGGQTLFPSKDGKSEELEGLLGRVLILEDNVKTEHLPITYGAKYIMRVGISLEKGRGLSHGDLLDEEMGNWNADTIRSINVDDLLGAKVRRYTPAPKQLEAGLRKANLGVALGLHAKGDSSLTRSSKVHAPVAGANEMKRCSFVTPIPSGSQTNPHSFPELKENEEQDDKLARCLSGRVNIDGDQDNFPSFADLPDPNESGASNSNAKLGRQFTKQTDMNMSASEYPSLGDLT